MTHSSQQEKDVEWGKKRYLLNNFKTGAHARKTKTVKLTNKAPSTRVLHDPPSVLKPQTCVDVNVESFE